MPKPKGIWKFGDQVAQLIQALKAELLGCQVLHADETPVAMLPPRKGKTQRA